MSTLLPEMEWELEDYLRLFRLHRGLILGTAILCGVFTAVQMSTQPNIYRATTRILIEAQTPQVTQFRELTPYVGASLQAFLQTEYQIITNPAVLERVISDLNLAAGPPFSMAEDPVAKLRGMITVELVRNTKLVDISAISTKRDLAARIANAVADTYARLNLERRQEMVTGGAEWLRDEVGKMEEKMKISQLALQAFREKHSNVDLGEEQQNTVIQRLRELTTVVTEAKKLRIEAETKYRQKHPALLELQAKEQELQQALSEQEQKALELNRLSIEYNTLLRDSKTSESIYNALLTRLKELSVQEGIQSNNVQVVSRAKTPKDPIGPNRRRAFFFSVLFGLFLGSVLVFLREGLTKTLQTRWEFEQLLGIPFLGYIPQIKTQKAKARTAKKEGLVLLSEPHSPSAEAIRTIRTTLEFLLPVGQPHALVITSALPEEGKTFTSLNLAMALQELGRKVLLVDGDLRRPTLHRHFQIQFEPGLSDYLQDKAAAEDLIQATPLVSGLSVIPAGSTPVQSTDLLSGSKLRDLIDRWKKEFQYVLIDAPPVLVAADSTVLANAAEGAIYIVRAGRTHREASQAGKQRLMDVGVKIIGGILNGAHMELQHGYRYYYYYRGGERRRAPASPPAES